MTDIAKTVSMSDISPFSSEAATPPVAKKVPFEDTRHGISRSDDYAWMRAENWQEMFHDPSLLDPAIRTHLEAENAYAKALMADTEDLREKLFVEMKGRIKEDDSSIPLADGDYAYGTKFVLGGEHPKFIRTPRDGGEETVILDGDAEAEGKAYFRLGSVDHSPNHRRALWGHDSKGSEFYTLAVRSIGRTEDTDRIEKTGGSGTWAAGSDAFLYTRLDDNHRPKEILLHRLGDPSSEDVSIYTEDDNGMFMSVGGTRLNDWIMISVHDHETTEYRLLPADLSDLTPKIVHPREEGLQYELEEGGDVFFILTNADGAKDFKVMQAPVEFPGKESWQEIVPHEPGRLILSIASFSGHLVRLERKDGLPRIVIRDRQTGEEHAIAFEEEAYSLGLGGSYEYDTTKIRFSYSSMTTPSQLYEYDMVARERRLLKEQEVPSGHAPSHYVTRRLQARSHDGERVPVSILYHKDTPLDGTAPCLLYGYGSYGISIPASFSTSALSLVNRGFIYAIAHIRGGKDKGWDWYETGKRTRKTNTFHDFIAAAAHLVSHEYTRHDRIVAQGGSAGGMLMGAVANMAPESFGGIIAEVPFVDVLTTMLDDTLPLTPPEWPEWGNPIASAEDYATIAAYSPVDNVAALPYPPILALAGLTDPRVTYWEPAKWVGKIRDFSTSGNPVLFKVNMDAGHAGASGRFSRLEEVAFSYAFALKVAEKLDAEVVS